MTERAVVLDGVEVDLHNHLLAREQSVGDELSSSDGDLRVSHVYGVSKDLRLSRNGSSNCDEVDLRRSNCQCAWHSRNLGVETPEANPL